jgi:hypothetical protein
MQERVGNVMGLPARPAGSLDLQGDQVLVFANSGSRGGAG